MIRTFGGLCQDRGVRRVAFRSQAMTMWSDVRRAGAVPADDTGDAGESSDTEDRQLSALYAEHSRLLLRLAVLLVSDITVAEEIVHDAFATMCSEQKRLRDTGAVTAFLLRAVIRGTRSAANRKTPGDSGGYGTGPGYGPVLNALRTLKSSQREALVLRYYASLPEEQAAAAMNVRLAELKAHVAGGMGVLSAILERESLARE
jgi:DNA-directed RNA polymerase specialized sigma24 family protein